MRAALDPVRARRRFVGLTALRWLPVGIATPVTVLLASARGLSPADIGVTLAVYGAVTLLLELPTGGFSDAFGHRPVLAASGLFSTAALATLAVADSVLLFSVAWALKGVARALDSGPLEAWYVDAARAQDPTADVGRGLAHAGAADGVGLALGAVLGGTLPLLLDRSGPGALAVPLVLAAGVALVHVAAVLLLVVPVEPARPASGVAALRSGVREVPLVVTATVRLVTGDRVLRLLLAISFLVGVVLTGLELLGPLQVADLAGSAERGSAAYGVVTAAGFAATALGSLLAPAAGRLARGSVVLVSAVTSVAAAAMVAAVAAAPGVVVAGVAFTAFYLVNALAWPSRKELMHGRTTSSQRSTTVSAASFALMLGGLLGNLLLPRLADSAGLPAGLLAAAGAMLLVAAVSPGLGTSGAAGPGRETPAGGPSRHGPGPRGDQPAALPGGLRERARPGARVHRPAR